MTEITDLSTTDSSNTSVSGESLDGAIANMGRMDNTLQAVMGLLARSIRTNVLRFLDNTDPTKKVKLDLSGLPTATERTWTAPYYSGTLGLVSDIRGQIYGLTLSNNVTDATNDIDIAAGAAVDTTGTVSMLLASALTKRLDAAWAVGTNQGGLDTGAIANTTYHVFLIRRPDTGVVDALFSTSVSAPTLPANYTQFRRIGTVMRVSGSIRLFTQIKNIFYYASSVVDRSSTSFVAYSPLTLSVPIGIVVQPHIAISQVHATAGRIISAVGPVTASVGINALETSLSGESNSCILTAIFYTNTSAQIGFALQNISGGGVLTSAGVLTLGFTDINL